MGVIQNAINQMLGMANIAARLSPGYETKQELYKLGKQETALRLQQESLPTVNQAELQEGKTVTARQHKEILEKKSKVAQKQFELNPTKETMENALFARSSADKAQKSMLKVARKQAAKQTQKRNFKDYLGKLETSLGGKVGNLPIELQKTIAKQYSKQDRKKIMDTMDKEKKDGNK